MQEIRSVRFTRECEVTQIPSGQRMTMGADTPVDITQSLGGAYTVRSPQGLFRVDANDADALGFEVPEETKPSESGQPATEQEVWDSLKQVYDPEIPVNIVDLGLVYDLVIEELPEGGGKRVQMKCPSLPRVVAWGRRSPPTPKTASSPFLESMTPASRSSGIRPGTSR